jgi:hypothetical protein
MTKLWRKAFDAIERPLAAGTEAWVQSDTFMDLTAFSLRVQHRMLGELHDATERGLHLVGFVSRGDVLRLTNQVASLERQVRDLRHTAEQRDAPPLNGRGAGGRSRSRPRTRQPSTGGTS